jgi:hypothetical protein
LLVRRSVVHGRVGETKTEASRLPLPVDPRLAAAFQEHGVGVCTEGRRTSCLRTAPARRAGIAKIGWHTFRHSYSSLLRRVGADIKVQQELLRHSDHLKHDECLYTGDAGAKRAANSVVARSVLPFESCGGVTALSGGREWEPIATGELLSGCGGGFEPPTFGL